MSSICIVPISPMRKESSHRSEMVSQLLFGEHCEIVEEKKDWKKVRASYDNYEGWCQDTHIIASKNPQLIVPKLNPYFVASVEVDGSVMYVPFGSDLSLFNNTEMQLSGHKFSYNGETVSQQTAEPNRIESIAKQFLNVPYLWGGRSVFGVDCSGFCQQVFKFVNIKLLRDAYQQATQGEVVGFLQEARKGDLAFFDNEEGRITHVGLLLDNDLIIHSSGKVRIDKMDHQGIINADTGKRTHQLRIIKRYF